MPSPAGPFPSRVQFGVFEVDVSTGELRKSGLKIKLEGQPIQILKMLLERPGQLVTREELKQELWPGDTFVDFEVSINAAVKRLRQALDDSADTPRFIETLPRRGYRFIYPVDVAAAGGRVLPEPRTRRPLFWLLSGLTVLAVGVLALVLAQRGTWTSPSGTGAPIRSLAILPLDNLTGDAGQEYLVDGLHDELITEMARMGGFEKVISRTSVLQYKGTKKLLPKIARELDVDGVVEGGVQRGGDRLRVTVQLISASEDRHVWAHTFERDLSEASLLPSEIAGAIALKLGFQLAPQTQAGLNEKKTVAAEVYRAYLSGKYFAGKWTNESLWRAIRNFKEALDLDPTYAPAWAAMGTCYVYLGGFLRGADLSRDEALLRAKAALLRAAELDPTLREPHQVLGGLKQAEWDWEGATREFQRARELDPAWAPSRYLIAAGRFDEAVAAARHQVEVDPLGYDTQLVLGWTYFMVGRFDESIAQLKKVVKLDPGIHHAHYELAWNYAKKGMSKEAIEECEIALSVLRTRQPNAFAAQGCGWVYALAGRRREALEIAAKLENGTWNEDRTIQLAHLYDGLGDRNRALTFLSKAFEERAPNLPSQWYSPMVSDQLRADPRLQELVRRTGIPWAKFQPPSQPGASAGSKPQEQRQP